MDPSELRRLDPHSLVVHAGLEPDPATGAVVPPLHMASTFARDGQGALRDDFLYGRADNPTRRRYEHALADLEGAAGTAAFGSGLAATSAVFSLLKPGARVMIPSDRYVGVGMQTQLILPRWGVEVVEVDPVAPTAMAEAIEPGIDLVWMETPSNPRLAITDIAATAEAARAAGAISVSDGTCTTPLVTRGLDLGCDLVVHSTSKYVGGHSDIIGGLVAWREEGATAERIREAQCFGGGVPSPFDCWLLMRGLRTMALRVEAHARNAESVARALREHPNVESVMWPGFEDHPGHAVAARQMRTFGGLVSFLVRGDADATARVAAGTRLFTPATSLGGVESLIEHRAVAEGDATRSPANLIRLSVGIESGEDLVADLDRALALV